MSGSATVPHASPRPIEGVAVGISVAYGEDTAQRGFSEAEMNCAIVRLADGLLAAGARLVFGHDWRPSGVMAAVADLAVRYEPSLPPSEGGLRPGLCRITNLVPWGRPVELPQELRKGLEERGLLRVEEVPLPESLVRLEPRYGRRILRAAALSLLRHRLAELCDARVCLGGKYRTYEGFWAGIIEEAWTGAVRQQPVYLSKLLGGAAGQLLDAARTGDWETVWSCGPDAELRRGIELVRQHVDRAEVRLLDFDSLPEFMNARRLQTASRLEPDDWERLVAATDIAIVTALVSKGLRQVSPTARGARSDSMRS